MRDIVSEIGALNYQDVLDFVIKKGFCSISMLQREFYLNYNTAARIQEKMEADGILAPYENNISRVITKEKP
jgi:DNA segregation ATPase FtsK/SpoIIIE-like protein